MPLCPSVSPFPHLRASLTHCFDDFSIANSTGRTALRREATKMGMLLPYTGQEFLDSLDDGREVWIYGERVKNIAAHPGFRNSARIVARLYDALHRDHAEQANVLTCPTEWGGFTQKYFVAPRSAEDLVAGRDAIAAWARLTWGWYGRSPDYKAALTATLGGNTEFYAPYQENAGR